jgi:(p)ppGpp synthase/HD superfamily hydrolase
MRKSVFNFLAESSNAETIAFIKKAHSGQKWGGAPYWKHPVAVMNTGIKVFGSKFDVDARQIALLHDVVEDTPYTLGDLKQMGYSDSVIKGVGLLTKPETSDYLQYVAALAASGHKAAAMVKYADNVVNISGDKSGFSAAKRKRLNDRYAASLKLLGKKLGVRSDFVVDEEGFFVDKAG